MSRRMEQLHVLITSLQEVAPEQSLSTEICYEAEISPDSTKKQSNSELLASFGGSFMYKTKFSCGFKPELLGNQKFAQEKAHINSESIQR